MATLTVERRSRVEQVRDRLRALATGPGMAAGDRLQSLGTLARRFGVSVPTVQRAIAQLTVAGVLESRHGSGIYVTSPHAPLGLEQAVGLCMEVGADVFGELATRLLHGVHEQGCIATLVDTASSQAETLLQRVSHSGMSCLVVHGNSHFPFEVLRAPTFRRKPIIGVIDWETNLELPGMSRVLSDFAAAGRMVAEHLWELGHRRLLLIGTRTQVQSLSGTQPWCSPVGVSLAAAWTALGGSWQSLTSVSDSRGAKLDACDMVGRLSGRQGATAIVGLRDCEAHVAQRVLRQHPALARRTAIVGYYDTPWSLASDPPLTAVSLDLPALAQATLAVLVPLLAGQTVKPTTVLIPPRLVVRGTSLRCQAAR